MTPATITPYAIGPSVLPDGTPIEDCLQPSGPPIALRGVVDADRASFAVPREDADRIAAQLKGHKFASVHAISGLEVRLFIGHLDLSRLVMGNGELLVWVRAIPVAGEDGLPVTLYAV